MAYHCYYNEPCPACGGHYVRFDITERCPFCGSAEAPIYPLVEEVLGHARLTLAAQGNLELASFRPATMADRYVVHGYTALEAYRRHPELDPATVAQAAVEEFRLTDSPELAAHWGAFLCHLLAAYRESRGTPLPVGRAAHDPLRADTRPADGEEA